MEPVRFESLYDLLAVELDRSADAVRAAVSSDPESLGAAATEVIGKSRFSWDLAEPIVSQEGSMTLLAAGTDFSKKVASIVSRQGKDPDVPLGPVILTPSDSLIGHFRKMILGHMTPVIDELKASPPPALLRIFNAVKPQQRAFMDSTIEKGVSKSFVTANGLMTMLQIVKGDEFAKCWRLSLESAYVAMAIMGAMSELSDEEDLKPAIETVGNAALFQDFSVILKPAFYAKETMRHPLRSAQIAESFGLDKQVCSIIELHHTFNTDEPNGVPSESAKSAASGPKAIPVEAKVLVVANLFMSALHDSSKLGGDIDAIKGLNFVMAEGRVDKRAVVTLTRLYLSHKFALFFEKAMEIAALCPFSDVADPILWNILGERNPQKFICSYKDCAHLGSQQTLVSQTIPVKFDGKVISKIRKGEYNSCRFLTNKLADLYKEISLLNTK